MLRDNIQLQNIRVAANLIGICDAALKELAGDTLNGNHMVDLEQQLALEINQELQERNNA